MKIAVYKDRDSKEYKLYESCMFDSKYYNPNFICHIDLPIESAKEEKKDRDVVLPNYNKLVYDLLVKEFGDKQDKKKKLVTKEAVELHLTSALIMDGSGASYPVFCVPSNAKNVRCAYEVEE